MQIRYLNKEQYETLLGGGTVTVSHGATTETISYSDEDQYCIETGLYRHDIYIEHLNGTTTGQGYTNVYLSFINGDPEPIEISDDDNLENLTQALASQFPNKMVPLTYGRVGTGVLSAMQLTTDWDTVTFYGSGTTLRDGVTDAPLATGFIDNVVKVL